MSYCPVPPEFEERLHDEFDGRLRCRWSRHENAFVIEQKVRRSLIDAFPVLNDRDDLIRLRDGYIKILSVTRGDRMPCPTCGQTLRVPIFETGMITCDFCYAHSNEYQYFVGFFELNDRLIEYLRSLDPMRGRARANRDRVNATNAAVEKGQERVSGNVLEAAVSDNFTQIAGIPSVGYTGKEFSG